MKNGAKFLEDIQMEDIDFDEDERSQLIKYVLNQCKNTYYIDSYKCIIDDQFCESKNLENLIKDREVFLDQLFNL
ncbi:MAG TPA: hypothetical protein DF610_03570 [Sphingobacterium sp.]|nr:hypothetical protein [Sphingobacterium sp.]